MANPNIQGRIPKGTTPGRRFQPGICPNPGGKSKLRAEYEAFKDRLFDPAVRDAAFATLKRAVEKGELWAVNRWFDLAIKVLPQPALELNVAADLTVGRKEYDDQLAFITEQLARYAVARSTAGNPLEIGPAETTVQLAVLGPAGSTGTDR